MPVVASLLVSIFYCIINLMFEVRPIGCCCCFFLSQKRNEKQRTITATKHNYNMHHLSLNPLENAEEITDSCAIIFLSLFLFLILYLHSTLWTLDIRPSFDVHTVAAPVFFVSLFIISFFFSFNIEYYHLSTSA